MIDSQASVLTTDALTSKSFSSEAYSKEAASEPIALAGNVKPVQITAQEAKGDIAPAENTKLLQSQASEYKSLEDTVKVMGKEFSKMASVLSTTNNSSQKEKTNR